MWELDSKERWAPKIDTFELCYWRRLLKESLDCKEIQPVHPEGNQSWIFTRRTDAEAETPILWPPDEKNWLHLKRPWCWERLKAGGGEDDRGWDGWMASPIQWTWVWVNSESWRWAGRPSIPQPLGSQNRTRLSDWTDHTWVIILEDW